MNFYKNVCKLSNVKRFCGLKLHREYSGADHSFRVAMLGMLIADEYNSKFTNQEKINVELVLRAACLHDLEESICGDISTPVKSYPGFREIYQKMAADVMENQILSDVPANKELYLKIWKEDKAGPSGEVITVADRLEALLTCAYELKCGNQDVQKAFNNIRTWFELDSTKELLKKFPIAQKLLAEADEVHQIIERFSLTG
jgi:5'-deoxynucleotidase YfbR-like HD superfamily hydrolase